MPRPTPVRDGFSAVWHQPSFYFAELAWRWSWGGAALFLGGLAFFEYLHTLPVTRLDLLLLRTGQPALAGQALAHIFHGSGARLVMATILMGLPLVALWVVLASMGRMVTLRGLLERFVPDKDISSRAPMRPMRAMVALNFLRAALALAGVAALLGGMILAGFISTPKHPRPGLAFLAFLPLLALIWMLWSSVNWFLSLAATFVARDGQPAFAALSSAVDLCRRQACPIAAASFWFWLMHVVAFVAATTAVMFPLSLASLVPGKVTLILVGALTLAYFALVDYFYTARLAGYVALAEWDRNPPPEPPPVVAASVQRFDDDEPLFAVTVTATDVEASAEFPEDDDILSDTQSRSHPTDSTE